MAKKKDQQPELTEEELDQEAGRFKVPVPKAAAGAAPKGAKGAAERVRTALVQDHGLNPGLVQLLMPFVQAMIEKYGPLAADLIVSWLLARFKS